MAILRIDDAAIGGGACPHALRSAGRTTDGHCVILIHGYRYDPRRPYADPHRSLYADAAQPLSWPSPLGFSADGTDGLCIGFGWAGGDAILRRGLWDLSEAYLEAGRAGTRLGRLIADLAQARGGPVDLMAHSLGARVALAAMAEATRLGGATIGRALFLGPAVYAQDARADYAACGAQAPEVYSFLSARNALFDRAFETMAGRGKGAALGRTGLGRRRVGWIDIEFDDPALPARVAGLAALAPAGRAPCHWSFYTRPGALALHRALLRRAPGSAVAELRRSGAPERAAPSARRSNAHPWRLMPRFGRRASLG